MEDRKIVQIAVVPESETEFHGLYVLDNLGYIWMRYKDIQSGQWLWEEVILPLELR